MVTKNNSISRDRLTRYLDEYLAISSITDDSLNGMQVEGKARISKIAFAVDACLESIRTAARIHANVLIVHHGLFWGRNERIIGVMQKRISVLLARRISLYAIHLPLDCHDEVGNNVELARILGLDHLGKFAEYKGTKIGVLAGTAKLLRREEIKNKLEKKLKTRVEMLSFGPSKVQRIGIVSGGAGFFAAEAKTEGCDMLITGETSHAAFHLAKEAGINVLFAGHYASETVGLKALAKHLQKQFSITCKFISAPTGF